MYKIVFLFTFSLQILLARKNIDGKQKLCIFLLQNHHKLDSKYRFQLCNLVYKFKRIECISVLEYNTAICLLVFFSFFFILNSFFYNLFQFDNSTLRISWTLVFFVYLFVFTTAHLCNYQFTKLPKYNKIEYFVLCNDIQSLKQLITHG